MKDNKGAVLILIVVILTVMATLILYSYSYFLFDSERDFLFSKYYERAIASALSCREAAMARLNIDFQYRTNNADILDFKCNYSTTNNYDLKDKDIYVDVFATGTVDVPKFIYPKPISIGIKSTVKISHIGPSIIKTIFQ